MGGVITNTQKITPPYPLMKSFCVKWSRNEAIVNKICSYGHTYERRTDRGPSVVGKHGDALWHSSPCDLPPTTLAPPRTCGGSNQKISLCCDNKRLRIYVPRHLAELADCCRVFLRSCYVELVWCASFICGNT